LDLPVTVAPLGTSGVDHWEPHQHQPRRGLHFGDVDVEEADRIGLELPPRLFVAFHLRQSADAVALQTAMEGRARQMRDGRLAFRFRRITPSLGDLSFRAAQLVEKTNGFAVEAMIARDRTIASTTASTPCTATWRNGRGRALSLLTQPPAPGDEMTSRPKSC
jgi:hypothetical protein